MSLRPEELSLVAAELDRELAGGVVQKVYTPTTTRVYLEVRVPGRSQLILVCSDAGLSRVSAVEERPSNPATPPGWQSVLRRDLTGARLVDAEALPGRKTLLLHFTKGSEQPPPFSPSGVEGPLSSAKSEHARTPSTPLGQNGGRVRHFTLVLEATTEPPGARA